MEIACRRPGRRVGRDPALPDQPAALEGQFSGLDPADEPARRCGHRVYRGSIRPWQNAGCSGSLLENRGLRRVYHLFHLFAGGVFSFGKRQQRVRGSLHPAQHSALLGRNCLWTGCRRRTAENGRYITAKADIQKRRELRHAA